MPLTIARIRKIPAPTPATVAKPLVNAERAAVITVLARPAGSCAVLIAACVMLVWIAPLGAPWKFGRELRYTRAPSEPMTATPSATPNSPLVSMMPAAAPAFSIGVEPMTRLPVMTIATTRRPG